MQNYIEHFPHEKQTNLEYKQNDWDISWEWNFILAANRQSISDDIPAIKRRQMDIWSIKCGRVVSSLCIIFPRLDL